MHPMTDSPGEHEGLMSPPRNDNGSDVEEASGPMNVEHLAFSPPRSLSMQAEAGASVSHDSRISVDGDTESLATMGTKTSAASNKRKTEGGSFLLMMQGMLQPTKSFDSTAPTESPMRAALAGSATNGHNHSHSHNTLDTAASRPHDDFSDEQNKQNWQAGHTGTFCSCTKIRTIHGGFCVFRSAAYPLPLLAQSNAMPLPSNAQATFPPLTLTQLSLFFWFCAIHSIEPCNTMLTNKQTNNHIHNSPGNERI